MKEKKALTIVLYDYFYKQTHYLYLSSMMMMMMMVFFLHIAIYGNKSPIKTNLQVCNKI